MLTTSLTEQVEDENLGVVVYQFNTLNIYSFPKGTTLAVHDGYDPSTLP